MCADNSGVRQEINALEDACLGAALIIDDQADSPPGQRTTPSENDPFMQLVMGVLEIRTEDLTLKEHHEKLDELWETIQRKIELPEGAFEVMAQRGASLGKDLREPPSQEDESGELVALAETDSGRTIWGVNVDGWDEDVYQSDDITLGMNPDGTVEPVEIGSKDESDRTSSESESE